MEDWEREAFKKTQERYFTWILVLAFFTILLIAGCIKLTLEWREESKIRDFYQSSYRQCLNGK